MFFDPLPNMPDWSPALRKLRRDPVMKSIIARVGPCTLSPKQDAFISLVQSIYAQQINTKIATTLYNRFASRFSNGIPTPRKVYNALNGGWDEETIRFCGLSRQKRAYALDLAKHCLERKTDFKSLAQMDDETVIQALVAVKGIGRWTAEMFLIFTLNRPDVLPVDDLGIRESMRRFYGLRERPRADKMRQIAEQWRPFRTVASWYLWRGGALEEAQESGDKAIEVKRAKR